MSTSTCESCITCNAYMEKSDPTTEELEAFMECQATHAAEDERRERRNALARARTAVKAAAKAAAKVSPAEEVSVKGVETLVDDSAAAVTAAGAVVGVGSAAAAGAAVAVAVPVGVGVDAADLEASRRAAKDRKNAQACKKRAAIAAVKAAATPAVGGVDIWPWMALKLWRPSPSVALIWPSVALKLWRPSPSVVMMLLRLR
jgi:hypothetical protein